jgi:hypothetical protein
LGSREDGSMSSYSSTHRPPAQLASSNESTARHGRAFWRLHSHRSPAPPRRRRGGTGSAWRAPRRVHRTRARAATGSSAFSASHAPPCIVSMATLSSPHGSAKGFEKSEQRPLIRHAQRLVEAKRRAFKDVAERDAEDQRRNEPSDDREDPARQRPYIVGHDTRHPQNPSDQHYRPANRHGACLRIRKAATPDPDVQELYRHLNISPDIIKAQHTWAPQDSD